MKYRWNIEKLTNSPYYKIVAVRNPVRVFGIVLMKTRVRIFVGRGMVWYEEVDKNNLVRASVGWGRWCLECVKAREYQNHINRQANNEQN